MTVSNCRLTANGSCGFAGAGQRYYVQNTNRQRGIRVTYEVTNDVTGSFQKTIGVAAGGTQFIGCSRSNNAGGGRNSFRIVGCQVL